MDHHWLRGWIPPCASDPRRSVDAISWSLPGSNSSLAVRLIGQLEIRRAGQWLTGSDIGSRKARLLLALLALEHGVLIGPRRITAALWPARPPSDPEHNVATMVSRIRRRFGSGLVVGGRAGYRLGDAVAVDLHHAAGRVVAAEAALLEHAAAAASTMAHDAVRVLSTGDILDDEPNELWAEPARVRQRSLLRRARHCAARSALLLGDSVAAVAAAESAFTADPFDEAACRLLMRAHHDRGDAALAFSVFQRLRSTLTDELGVDPSPATRELHVAILRGVAPMNRATPAY